MSGARLALLPLAAIGLAAVPAAWEELTPADALYDAMTRVATIEGHAVHYPTPTAELARLLEARPEAGALRQLAEARFALGDREGALDALRRWAEAQGPAAWDEAARWAALRLEMAFAFRAAERAVAGLEPEARRALLDERVAWADRHPDQADPLALRAARAAALPEDAAALEDWVSALERAGRFDEALGVLATSPALAPERRLLLRSDLLADRKDARRAYETLDAEIEATPGIDVRQAFARRVDEWNRQLPEEWRGRLERRFDAPALVRLAAYFQGQGRGDKAAELLRQMERRHEDGLDRAGLALLSRLFAEIDAVPEAFRAGLAASQLGSEAERAGDLPALARLALRAGARPLAWGRYRDEAYRWLARVDRGPGFWTGGLSFLLTGQDWPEALRRLEAAAVPERTFETARLLVAELERRAPESPELPALRVALMERHVERGEGHAALELLPRVESGAAPGVADEARRVALLAARQVELPESEETRLLRARLRFVAPDGSRPSLAPPRYWQPDWSGPGFGDGERPWRRPARPSPPAYGELLNDAAARLDQRDGSHRATVALFLEELDRLPDAEALWLDLAQRLEAWNLDDDLGPRYERALQRFEGPEWWARAARFYARRSRSSDLRRLASDLAGRFRGSALFDRARAVDVRLELPEQPRVGERVRLAPFADLVRLQALERFPHSPRVVQEALAHLEAHSAFEARLRRLGPARLKPADDRVIVPDELLDARRWAVLFGDPQRREEYFSERMDRGALEEALRALESDAEDSPVRDRLLFEGWARLSRFEEAAPYADRLSAAYPGDAAIAREALSLHRSLAGLDPAHGERGRAIVERSAAGVVDPAPLTTELGELHQDRGDPRAAVAAWHAIVDREPRNPDRIRELATLLWDYGHVREALDVVEQGRARLSRPRFLAFEAGVLREELRDLDGALSEYLSALEPESGACFCSAFEEDQRSLRRLAQLLGRPPVFGAVARRVESLRPGVRADEETLAALLPLGTLTPPTPGLDFDADDWIDAMDLPHDPVGRARRAADREAARPLESSGIERIAEVLLRRAEAMAPQASAREFLDALERWAVPLLEARDAERAVDFQDGALARRAALLPSEEERLLREIERARFLVEHGRREAADALWTSLGPRIAALPEGAGRLRAEADYAGFVERTRGVDAAAREWQRLAERHPWSLGVLEDRLAFLERSQRHEEARAVLEAVAPEAGDGRRELLLERLVRASLEQGDRVRARRAIERLLAEPDLEASRRLGAIHLLARLRLQEDAAFDLLTLAESERERLRPELVPDLYAQLAQAADVEQAWLRALPAWIEALNRRPERGWLASAARSAQRAGRAGDLRAFFERQQERSPRDVRWAVAVRELRRHQDDVEGAIAMARTATIVRPERESLWREAAELMLRGDRVAEAADFLEGWSRPRPGDEGVAAWRSGLYARAGNGERALQVEREALSAYEQAEALSRERRAELQARRGRAVRRLLGYGFPGLALRLAAPTGDVSRLSASGLDAGEQAELCLAAGRLPALLRAATTASSLEAAARVFAERSRTEDQDALHAFLLEQIWPSAGPSPAGLQRYWPFVESAGLEGALRLALAERHLAAHAGAWSADPPLTFVEDVGAELVERRADARGASHWHFAAPPLERLWVRDLAGRDQSGPLAAFLAPRLRDALATARGQQPLEPSERPLLDWAAWLDAPALEVWARGLRDDAALVEQLSAVFSRRHAWDRFWALLARGWNVAPLVAVLSEDARGAWFAFWAPPETTTPPQRAAALRVSRAVGRLVAGESGAAADPEIAKLRGPRLVGDVLGDGAAWRFAEFDSGTPEALWGGRPGEAWWVLETLARQRAGEPDAARLPLEVPDRGKEAERRRLAARLAELQGDVPLAIGILEAGGATDAAAFERTLRLLVTAGRSVDAGARLAAETRRRQPGLDEPGLRALEALAAELHLPGPLDALDPAAPLRPALLAYLHDDRGARVAGRFRSEDTSGFRAALSARFAAREEDLDAERIRFWLFELWARGASGFPKRGLRRLGGLWPHAAGWLETTLVAERLEALAAVEALPDPARLRDLTRGRADAAQDPVRLLALRAALRRGDQAEASRALDELFSELRGDRPLSLEPVALETPAAEEEEWAEEGFAREPGTGASPAAADPVVARFEAWLDAFRDEGWPATAEARVADFLRDRRDERPVSAEAWRLAFRLAPDDAARAGLARELEHAWLRGDLAPESLGDLVRGLSRHAPSLMAHWLARWPETPAFDVASARAAALARVQDADGAARALLRARERRGFSAAEEIRAFDQWRRLGSTGVPVPAAWTQALPFWTAPAGDAAGALADHLCAHPTDLLAARAALRSLAPTSEAALLRALVALRGPALESLGEPWADARVLQIRRLRGLRDASPRAARAAFDAPTTSGLADDLTARRFPKRDADAALADLARVLAATGDVDAADALVATLSDRRADGVVELRRFVAAARDPRPPLAFRPSDGRPSPWLPRDLTWGVLAGALAGQEVP